MKNDISGSELNEIAATRQVALKTLRDAPPAAVVLPYLDKNFPEWKSDSTDWLAYAGHEQAPSKYPAFSRGWSIAKDVARAGALIVATLAVTIGFFPVLPFNFMFGAVTARKLHEELYIIPALKAEAEARASNRAEAALQNVVRPAMKAAGASQEDIKQALSSSGDKALANKFLDAAKDLLMPICEKDSAKRLVNLEKAAHRRMRQMQIAQIVENTALAS